MYCQLVTQQGNCIYTDNSSRAFPIPIFTVFTDGQQLYVPMCIPRRITRFGAVMCWALHCYTQRKGGTVIPTVRAAVMRGWTVDPQGSAGYFCLSVASCQDKLLC